MATANLNVLIRGSRPLAGDQKYLVSLIRERPLGGWPDISKDAPLQQLSVGKTGYGPASAIFTNVDALKVFERNIPISGHTLVKDTLSVNSFRYKVIVVVTSSGGNSSMKERQIDIGYLGDGRLVWNYLGPDNLQRWQYDTNTITGQANMIIDVSVPIYKTPDTSSTEGQTAPGGGAVVVLPAAPKYKCPYGDYTGTYDEVVAHIKTAHPSGSTTTPDVTPTDGTTTTETPAGVTSQITSWVKNNPGVALVGILGIVLLATSGGGGGKRETVYLPAPRDQDK